MKTLVVVCVVACVWAVAIASPGRMTGDSLKSSQWLTPIRLEDTHYLQQLSFENLEKMPGEKGAELMQQWYHISQFNYKLIPSFVPSPSNIPVYIVESPDKKLITNLSNFVKIVKKDTSFGQQEVTIFITGLPSTIETVKQANHKLIYSYMERYNRRQQKSEDYKKHNEETGGEDSSFEWGKQTTASGRLIVIDLGLSIDSLEHLAMLNVEETGAMLGKALVQLSNDCDVPQDMIHVVAQGVAAHVAGVAGDEYMLWTEHKLRRITALDPSTVLSKSPQVLPGLARGDADFVDGIHTSVHGLGTLARVGDVDFFPYGPCAAVPGADNVLEASMRATLYFAESLWPGNERNFPAAEANSLQQFKSTNGFGKLAFMGIDTAYDLRGDYMLLVNEKSPFGTRDSVHKHNTYHDVHESWHPANN